MRPVGSPGPRSVSGPKLQRTNSQRRLEQACLRRPLTRYILKAMPEVLKTEPFPLETGPDGVIRVRGTRVTLDTLWAAFQDGATAEEIVQQYPSLSLADAYQVIGYCLRNRALVAGYLAKRSDTSEEVQRSNESRWSPEGVRARLLERQPR
jgi:uncharacterized protein (DUF433 family)